MFDDKYFIILVLNFNTSGYLQSNSISLSFATKSCGIREGIYRSCQVWGSVVERVETWYFRAQSWSATHLIRTYSARRLEVLYTQNSYYSNEMTEIHYSTTLKNEVPYMGSQDYRILVLLYMSRLQISCWKCGANGLIYDNVIKVTDMGSVAG